MLRFGASCVVKWLLYVGLSISRQVAAVVDTTPVCDTKALKRILGKLPFHGKDETPPMISLVGELSFAIESEGCVLASIPNNPHLLDGDVGPRDFVERQRKLLASAPGIVQMQPLGFEVDPEPLHQVFMDSGCAQRDVYRQTACPLNPGAYKSLRGLRGFIDFLQSFEPPLIKEIEFNYLTPSQFVEWHGDFAIGLVGAICTYCNVSTIENFRSVGWERNHPAVIRIHIPLTGQEHMRFFASGKALHTHMQSGRAYVFDAYQPHTLWNAGNESRTQLSIDIWAYSIPRRDTFKKLLKSKLMRKIITAFLRLGYHNPGNNAVRIGLEKALYEYQRNVCTSGQETVDFMDEFARCNRERVSAGLRPLSKYHFGTENAAIARFRSGIPCNMEANITAFFINQLASEEIHVFSVSEQGHEQPRGSLRPGSQQTFTTYPEQVWLFRSAPGADGELIENITIAGQASQTYSLNPSSLRHKSAEL